ncbi:MAG: methyltransferase [Anaerolineae bacterium]|nr:methyltransferase [Anaerolineae bacterium]
MQVSKLLLSTGELVLHRAPGMPEGIEAAEALARAVRRITARRVFVAGPGSTLTAVWAARSGADVVTWTENLAEAETLQATIAANGLPDPEFSLAADFTGLHPGRCDLALVHLPRGQAVQEELYRLAAAMVRPAARIYLVGATREGIKSAFERARVIFGGLGVLVRKGGYHAGIVQCPAAGMPLPEVPFSAYDVSVDGSETRLVSCPGVFAGDHLDEGAASLIAGMRIALGARVLDLGCGAGVVALAAARRGAVVSATDVSARAVASTQRTLTANGFPGATVKLSIGAAAFEPRGFDIVATNPPFHKGHGVDFEVARLFITESARVLRPGGALFLVANAFLKYEPWLQEAFGRVTLAWESPRFRVWQAIA